MVTSALNITSADILFVFVNDYPLLHSRLTVSDVLLELCVVYVVKLCALEISR